MVSVPDFTVIVPTHLRAGQLRRALSSIKNQVFDGSCEVVVVSDVADAATEDVCLDMLEAGDTYIRRSGERGPAGSRNFGLKIAKGNYVLFLDDDDAWAPGCLQAVFACDAYKQNVPIYFNATVITERRSPEGGVPLDTLFLDLKDQITEEIFVKNQIHMSCLAFPRNVLKGLHFDPHMRAYEDWEFMLNVFSRVMPVHIPFFGSIIYEADSETTDRRGESEDANNAHVILDYLYVYRRHPAPSITTKELRTELMKKVGLSLSPHYF